MGMGWVEFRKLAEVLAHFSQKVTNDEREEELLKFLNNVNYQSCGILEIFCTITKYILDPFMCWQRFISFQNAVAERDLDLRLLNFDIL